MSNITIDKITLDLIFGKKSDSTNINERAASSDVIFVRSQDHLGFFKPGATGRCFSASEALEYFGINKLVEVIDYGCAVLPISKLEPALSFKKHRESLHLTEKEVASRVDVTAQEIIDCEDSTKTSSIHTLIKLAMTLGLDERFISLKPNTGIENNLAVRLKTLREINGLSSDSVLSFSEASWVIRTQYRLRAALGMESILTNKFKKSSNYTYPCWQHGYELANKARQLLGIDRNAPIESLRQLCDTLGIPLLQTSLSKNIAGATIDVDGHRGIIVNTEGANENVWVRRSTIAHELGHLFWDPQEKLSEVRVDDYDDIDNTHNEHERRDPVEIRANAFAIAFLAPPQAVKIEFKKYNNNRDGLRAVMERFGISFTSAKHHINNVMGFILDEASLAVDYTPTDDWKGRESYTDDYFVIEDVPPLRRGEFSAWVAKAEEAGFISADTASIYLNTVIDTYQEKKKTIIELFPSTH